jgi:IS30 family transposase
MPKFNFGSEQERKTSNERDTIAYWYAVGESIREIARSLGRSSSSISNEIRRNKIGGRYHSIRAQQAAEARKHNSHMKYVLKTQPNAAILCSLRYQKRSLSKLNPEAVCYLYQKRPRF